MCGEGLCKGSTLSVDEYLAALDVLNAASKLESDLCRELNLARGPLKC
jgi:hypothetical protein